MRTEMTVRRPDFESMAQSVGETAHEMAALRAMRFFRDTRLPKRFDGSLRAELNWLPRDAGYERYKGRRFGSSFPHLKSGATRNRFRQGEIRATTTTMSVVIRNLHRGYGRTVNQRINLRKEIARLTDGEVEQIAKVYRDRFMTLLRLNSRTKEERL